MTTTSRRGRLFRRGDDRSDEENADLSEEEHAWWAARDAVRTVPHGTTPTPEDEPESDTQFADYWTNESLFDEVPGAAPKAEPGAEAAGTPELPSGMDLDSAHLVLQIPIGADWDAIVTAHRALAKLYHPDRLVDYAPVAQELGRARMAEINAAHATLRALHFH